MDGTCLPPGIPGTAKGNFFCKAGTYDEFENRWTVEIGHRVLAIARNPQTTYVLLNVLDQTTMKPFLHEIHCWAWLGKIIPGWAETPEGVEFDFEDLEVVIPPDPPEEEPDPEPENVCSPTSNYNECTAFGGKFDRKKNECHCP